jgi:tellurite methyltransferase
MPSNLSEWDAKYRSAAPEAAEAASFVSELLPLLPRGPALDIACGAGRHTLLLAARRQPVTAIDGSGVALDILEQRARAAHYPTTRITCAGRVTAAQQGIQLIQADLEHARLPANSFALVLCLYYLQRSLFPQIERALVPGGMLLFETYTRAQLQFDGGPKNPKYVLEQSELRGAFPGLEIFFYRELCAGKGIASIIARKPPG